MQGTNITTTHFTSTSPFRRGGGEVVEDYYALDMQMPARSFNGDKYRFGFNGKENDNEVKENGNQQDYGFRIYDPRLGRFLCIDPLTKKYAYTPYAFAGNEETRSGDGKNVSDNIDALLAMASTITSGASTARMLPITGSVMNKLNSLTKNLKKLIEISETYKIYEGSETDVKTAPETETENKKDSIDIPWTNEKNDTLGAFRVKKEVLMGMEDLLINQR